MTKSTASVLKNSARRVNYCKKKKVQNKKPAKKINASCRDQLNGDLAPENGDAYFMYGKALLQYAIEQNTVLGQSAQASATAVEEQQKEVIETEGIYRHQKRK